MDDISTLKNRCFSYDYLKISDGVIGSSSARDLGVYCSSSELPAPLTSSSNVASVLFHSDESSSDHGFVLTWSEVPGVPGKYLSQEG